MIGLKYDETFPMKAAGYAREGAHDGEIAAKLGISRSMFYNYKPQYPEFAEALESGRDFPGWEIGVIGVIGVMRVMEKKPSPAQRDSEMSILKTSPYRPYGPYRPLDFKTSPVQRDSKMSNGRLSGVSCWPHRQNTPAQQDSKMSNGRLSDLSEQSDLLAVRLVPQSGDPTAPKRKTIDS